ncbi:Tetraketide alpha-pyrone reductase 1 [Camellia lanceoleosa]|nr:Tetraketide alpha-pyrone reductase 1 [Camellia lanceoleosa]
MEGREAPRPGQDEEGNEAGEELERADKARGGQRRRRSSGSGGWWSLVVCSQTYPNASFGWINVKDVANAHIQAYEIPSANGRYCLVERVAHYSEVVTILHKLYPSFQLPEKSADDKPFVPTYHVSKQKAKTLGIDFISVEDGLKETVESLTKKKFFASRRRPVLFSDYNNTLDSTKSDVWSSTTTGEDDAEAEISFSKLFMRANPNRTSLCTDTSHRDCTRDSNPKKTEHLLALDGAKERLHLFKGNLLEEGSFDSVVDGCDGVFHTKIPCFLQLRSTVHFILRTLNVLGSCAKSPTVKRVVLTSSMAAVTCTGRPRTPDGITDETWFSDPEFCKENMLWYQLSKTLAEDAAWKFAKEKGIDMVVINPSVVVGPLLQPTLNSTSAAILELINGSQTYPNASYGWINVKDVANAHIQAYEIPSASGRYCLVERMAHFSEVVKILHELYPSFQLPEKVAGDKPYIPAKQVSKEKAKTLGIDFISLEEGLKEIVESLTQKKFVGM